MNRLLLVDDEPIILKGLRRLVDFEALGMRVVGEAYDGRQALELIERLKPDVVLTDIWMPVVDGVELMRSIRARGLRVQVIVLSGYSEFAYARQAVVYGALDYLLKPVGAEELSGALRRANRVIEEERRAEAEPPRHMEPDAPANEADLRTTIERIRAHITQNYAEDLTLPRLAGMFFMNPSYVSALFKKRYGETLTDYITRVRMEQAAQMLLVGDRKSYEISEQVGYKNVRHFNYVFKNYFGVNPTEYRGRSGVGRKGG
jgi:YesN/AraC family two-component response regulator